MPKVSVIVPVYNTEKYLHRCVDSILAQTFTDFELLLVNDGSTDGSGAICDEYAQKNSRVRVFHKENGGVSSARNLGMDKAQGEWITFVDSDDWLDVDFLSSLAMKTSDTDFVLELSDYNDISIEEKATIFNENIGNLLSWTVPWGKLFRCSLLKSHKIQFDCSVFSGEDTMFVFDYLALVNNISYSKTSYYNYRHNNGLSMKKLKLEQLDYIIKKLLCKISVLEEKFEIRLYKWKVSIIWNFVTKYKIKNNVFILFKDMVYITNRDYIKVLIEDKNVIPKGIYRHIFDFLFKYKMNISLTLVVFLCRRFYY